MLSRSSFLKRSTPVGERRGFKCPALIQRRRVGIEIPRCRAASAVPIHSDGFWGGRLSNIFALLFMVLARWFTGADPHHTPPANRLDAPTPHAHDGFGPPRSREQDRGRPEQTISTMVPAAQSVAA